MNSMSLKSADDCATLPDICASVYCVVEYMSWNSDFCLELQQRSFNCPACANFMADDQEDGDGDVLDVSGIGIKKHNDENSVALEPASDCATLPDICVNVYCVIELMNWNSDFCLELEQQGYSCPACANFMADDKELEDVHILDVSGINIKHNHNNDNSKGIILESNNSFDFNYIAIGLAIFLIILLIFKFIQAKYNKNSENNSDDDNDNEKQLQYNTFSNV